MPSSSAASKDRGVEGAARVASTTEVTPIASSRFCSEGSAASSACSTRRQRSCIHALAAAAAGDTRASLLLPLSWSMTGRSDSLSSLKSRTEFSNSCVAHASSHARLAETISPILQLAVSPLSSSSIKSSRRLEGCPSVVVPFSSAAPAEEPPPAVAWSAWSAGAPSSSSSSLRSLSVALRRRACALSPLDFFLGLGGRDRLVDWAFAALGARAAAPGGVGAAAALGCLFDASPKAELTLRQSDAPAPMPFFSSACTHAARSVSWWGPSCKSARVPPSPSAMSATSAATADWAACRSAASAPSPGCSLS